MTGRKRELVGRINCRPTLKPLTPASSTSSAPLPKGGSFLNHGASRSALVPWRGVLAAIGRQREADKLATHGLHCSLRVQIA
jgi:hypothetical protein